MLQSILKQNVALAAYSAEHDIPQLTPIQWDLLEKIFAVLNPVEEITVNINRDSFGVSYHTFCESISQNSGEPW